MGVSSKVFEEIYARPISTDAPQTVDFEGVPQRWQVTWRDPVDRGTWFTCLLMWLLRLAGIPSPAWHHHMASCSTESRARAFAAEIESKHGGRCTVYPMPSDECLPATPIRPKWLYSPTARGESALSQTLVVIEKREVDELRRIKQVLKGDE